MTEPRTNRDRLWLAMKRLPDFTVAELGQAAQVTCHATIGRYCTALHRSGDLEIVNPGRRNRRWRPLPKILLEMAAENV